MIYRTATNQPQRRRLKRLLLVPFLERWPTFPAIGASPKAPTVGAAIDLW